mmetsp:Transcript_12391/g.49661  ORF Transcript_12391/g.49661 Transcript_12391/m.49661 type:complete len:275 (-) Transcript_12391:308-1132(-)
MWCALDGLTLEHLRDKLNSLLRRVHIPKAVRSNDDELVPVRLQRVDSDVRVYGHQSSAAVGLVKVIAKCSRECQPAPRRVLVVDPRCAISVQLYSSSCCNDSLELLRVVGLVVDREVDCSLGSAQNGTRVANVSCHHSAVGKEAHNRSTAVLRRLPLCILALHQARVRLVERIGDDLGIADQSIPVLGLLLCLVHSLRECLEDALRVHVGEEGCREAARRPPPVTVEDAEHGRAVEQLLGGELAELLLLCLLHDAAEHGGQVLGPAETLARARL